ncbi:MAG: hypothetical protein PHN45_07435, partial [Methylococcales bacterium]|nr:hypothetical protein [Methylococcales bacterium]
TCGTCGLVSSPIANEFPANESGNRKTRKEFRSEARAARQWLIDNPAPKHSQSDHFLSLFDEPYLELTDELYFLLVNSGKFKDMSKSNFDYLRSQNILYDTETHTFFSSSNIVSQLIDLKDNFSKIDALVKTCETSGDFFPSSDKTVTNQEVKNIISPLDKIVINQGVVNVNSVWIFERDGKISPFPAGTPFFYTFKEFHDFEDKERNRVKSKIPKPVIKHASDFSMLGDLRSKQFERYKSPNPDDLQFLEFVDNTFESFRSVNDKTGEVSTFTRKGTKDVLVQPREQIISDRFSLQDVMAKVMPEHRVSKCLRVVQRKQTAVTVYKSNNFHSLSLSNLQSCGSVWDCPICAAKITEHRRKEVNHAIAVHKRNGGTVSFVTRTVPHTKSYRLLDMRHGFRKADAFMKGHSSYKSLVKRLGVIGSIKVYEVTVGEFNGWHLHVHEIFFHSKDAPFVGDAVSTNSDYTAFLETFRAGLYARWKVDAVKAGFGEPSEEHGLQVQNGDFAADYLAKWGVPSSSSWDASSELTKAHIKKSKKGFSPFDLIRAFRDTGDERLIPIIREYSESMFGQVQLRWSNGLKALFDIQELSDEELVEKLEDDAEEIGQLSPVQWKFIVKTGLRASFFILAFQGWDIVTNFLHSFDDYPRIFSLEEDVENS